MLHPTPFAAPPAPPPLHAVEPRPGVACANPTCRNEVTDGWEESGQYCARCAIEIDLYDRETRRERCFPAS